MILPVGGLLTVRATGWASATSQDTRCRATQSILYAWGVIGYQRQIDQTRLKIDAQPDLKSLMAWSSPQR